MLIDSEESLVGEKEREKDRMCEPSGFKSTKRQRDRVMEWQIQDTSFLLLASLSIPHGCQYAQDKRQATGSLPSPET
jgi:hypothetical protein